MSKVVKDLIYNVEINNKDAGKNLDDIKKSSDNLTGSLKDLVTGIGAMTIAFKAFEFAKESIFGADKLRQAKVIFKNYLKDSGDSYEEAIDRMRKATGNAISDQDLLMNTIKAKQFKLKTDSLKLMEIARKTAFITGRSTQEVFEDIVTASARQSMMIADNMNVTIKLSEAYKAMAKKLGVAVKDLTDEQKKSAFEFLFIQKLQENIAKSGVKDFKTLAESTLSFGNELKRVGVILGESILPFTNKIAKSVSNWSTAIREELSAIMNPQKPGKVYQVLMDNLHKYKKELADLEKKLIRDKAIIITFKGEDAVKTSKIIANDKKKIADLTKLIATYERNIYKIKQKENKQYIKQQKEVRKQYKLKEKEQKRIKQEEKIKQVSLQWEKEKAKLELDLMQDKHKKELILLEQARKKEIEQYGITEKIKLEINKLYNEKRAQIDEKYKKEQEKKEKEELLRKQEEQNKLNEELIKLEDGKIDDYEELEIRKLERERDREIKQWMKVEGMKAKITEFYDAKINKIKKKKQDDFNKFIQQENIDLIEDEKERRLKVLEIEEKELIKKYEKIEGSKAKIQALYAKKRAAVLAQDAEKNPYMLEVEQLEKSVIEMEKLYHRKQAMLETTGDVADELFEKAKKGESLHWKEMNKIVARGIQNELAAYGKKEAVLAVVYALTGQFAKAAKATAASIAAYAGVKALSHLSGGSPSISDEGSNSGRGSSRNEEIFGKQEEKPLQTNIYIQGSFIDNYDKLAQKITELQNKNNRRRDIKIVNSR